MKSSSTGTHLSSSLSSRLRGWLSSGLDGSFLLRKLQGSGWAYSATRQLIGHMTGSNPPKHTQKSACIEWNNI